MDPIEELSIAGGGVKGYAYLGALLQLERLGLLGKLRRVSGVSIGSLFASSLVLGYKMDELVKYIFDYDISEIKDIDVSGFLKRKSFLRGDKYRKFITDIIEKKVDKNITLRELYDKTEIELIIAVICVNDKSLKYISYKTDPDLDIITLIMMSSAIPGFLPPVQYNNKLYLDGGILDNNPVGCLSDKAIGICQKSKNKNRDIDVSNIIDFFSTILHILYSSIQNNIKNKHSRCIEVDNCGVDVLGFNIDKDLKLSLIQKGIHAVNEFIHKPPPST
jgi:predicted patatin/cPLA2 family phospholipase